MRPARPRPYFFLACGAPVILGWVMNEVAVALALSLPTGSARETLLALTYCVVVWSILGQGLTISHVARRVIRAQD